MGKEESHCFGRGTGVMGGSHIGFLLILANGSLGPDMKVYKIRKCGIFYTLKIEKQFLLLTASVCLSALQKGSSVHGLVFFFFFGLCITVCHLGCPLLHARTPIPTDFPRLSS